MTDTDTDTDTTTDEQPADTTTDDERTDSPLLVASLAESTGKTAITLALAQLVREDGDSAGYMKPKGTRLQSTVGKTLDEDPMLARELLELDAEMHDLEPVVYSPTFIEQVMRGREDPEELRERVSEAYETLAADHDRMFLEGGGQYEIGGIVDLTDADLAAALDAQVLLVAPYEVPGDIDDVMAAARSFGDRLAGVVFNDVADAAYDQLETDVVPFLEGRGITVYGVLPSERDLSGVTVADLADELGASMLVDEETDAYVERFAVGAMGSDSALRHFRRTKDAAVITGGDRADIHTAALEAPGVRCLILTGGHRPSGAILGQAAEKGLPILSVRTDTLTTVERAEDVVRSGRTRDAETVDRMQTLLTEHAAVDEILGVE
ncbi:phosphotransacetylase family protein [Natrarchaeobaculum sulfurireducens]|uniref:BioD-like N-terminal domain of phosphotransacetylase n=1 Tax=Natrarchaeobaculum sulfurireducens TaxID=2044521 RepID=A0A346PFA2_9EURY|nr:phosphotransacetylase family protein [Natrarchaeobaculum sulfurireducens]AXR78197.1 BioD-like N-terminal domain of phosphotransacetylase [Natrarchaeobaculum sulfurireducens]AXR81814.1 BioD-like N-terminal domain ofphosphotransacetylase [Natrarchaeobaculum sulfurireducens]